MVITMLATIGLFWKSCFQALGMFNRAINSCDAVLEVVEKNATTFRDTEIKRLEAEVNAES